MRVRVPLSPFTVPFAGCHKLRRGKEAFCRKIGAFSFFAKSLRRGRAAKDKAEICRYISI